MSLLVFAVGGAVLAMLARWWCPRLGWGWAGGYWLAAGAFFGAAVFAGAVQVPADVVYGQGPWREMVPGLVLPENSLLTDPPTQMVPWRALVRERLRRFEVPLWSHEMGTGQPLLGNAQSAVFSPLGLLAMPLSPVQALPVMAALKLFLSLLLMHALMLELGAGAAGAAFGAVAFTFSVFSICWALYPLGMAAAWLPGVFLGVVRLRRGGRGALAGLVACALGMALSGHPESLAHTALAAGAVALVLLVDAGAGAGGGVSRRRFAGGLVLAAIITAGMAAPVLLPFVEALPEAMRTEMVAGSAERVQPPALGLGGLRVLIDPLAFGSPRDGSYDGPWNYNELCSGYAGLLALGLAAAAALVLRGRALAILAGGAAAAGAAFALPPLLAMVRALPLLDRTANGRMRLLWILAVAVGGGLGLEKLAARRSGRYAAGVCIIAFLLAALLDPPPALPWERGWWLAALIGGGLTAAAFLWLGARRSAGAAAVGAVTWLAVAALAVDLVLLNVRYNPVLPRRFDLAPPPAVALLMREQRRDRAAPFRVLASGYDLTPNLAAFYGLWDPRANDPMQPARAALVLRLEIRPQDMMRRHRPYATPFLSYLDVRYMLTRHGEPMASPWLPVWEGRGGKIWRNPEALPLVFMPRSWRAARDASEALAATLSNADFGAYAVAELVPGAAAPLPELSPPAAPALPETQGVRPAAGLAADTAAPAGSALAGSATTGDAPGVRRLQQGQAVLRALAGNAFEADVASPSGGLVASSISFSRSWRLSLDGEEAPIVCVNSGFVGFLVPPGSHHAALAYRPAGWTWGLRVCGSTSIALLLGYALPAARRRAWASGAAPRTEAGEPLA